MATKSKSYAVMVKGTYDTNVYIPANSLEEALEKAKAFKIDDVLDFPGEINDYSINTYGVFESS